MLKATSFRRQVIMAVLLTLSVTGAAMRYWADNPSLARDIGTLLLVLWVPAIGNLISFLVARLPRRARKAPGFATDAPFVPQLRAELAPLDGQPPQVDHGAQAFTLLVDKEGFTARAATPLSQWLEGRAPQVLELQFLRPAVAMPKFAPGTRFHMLVGETCVGTGRVVD